ncbi:hypothetical protein OG883_15845 [Streptomyces sp. NBC_01142]|uniref:hypothetical protein n=1 Tax=Streptomyces sp. NBC_01142 TaxID=2975865 RepID=UPI00225A3991|nr:hypothetical protein [Streptomyces sp. NBC_01142]MCX4821352.1 hypothetical protein [Streptomyces sp. NBC_01142]
MAARYELVEDGRAGGAVKVVATGPGGKDSRRTVAHLLRSSSGGPNAYRPGAREIVLYGGDDARRKVLAIVTTEHGTGFGIAGPAAVYLVQDPDGAPIGRIRLRRGLCFRLGRSRWTVDQKATSAGTVQASARGVAGRLGWWALWWTVFLPYNIVMLLALFAGAGEDPVTTPRRIVWRDNSGRTAMIFRGMAGDYRVMQEHWDPRLVAALVGIHQTYASLAITDSKDWYHR